MVFLDVFHLCKAFLILKGEENESWADVSLCMHHIMSQDLVGIQQAGTDTLNNVANMSSTSVSKDSSFMDIIKAVLNYAGMCEL